MKNLKKWILFGLVASILVSATANAAVLVFTDRASWRAAAGGGTGNLSEDFNSFVGVTNYGDTTGIDAGFLHFAVTASDHISDSSWSVRDVADLAGSKTVNGSPYVSLVSYSSGTGDTLITHGNLTAIGFDYAGPSNTPSNDANPLTVTTSRGDDITGPTILGESSGFFGFVYTEGEVFDSMQIRDLTDERTFFGADNFEAYGDGAVIQHEPVPSLNGIGLALLILMTGSIGFAVVRRT